MAELKEISRTRDNAGQGIVIEDYDVNPSLCRRGLWTGLATYFTETVTLSYEHDPEELNVFWRLQSADILYPVTGFFGAGPVLGTPGVHYRWPVDGLQHRISFVCAPGTASILVNAQVLYQKPPNEEIEYGPSLTIRISGQTVSWPYPLRQQEQRCHERWREIRTRYVRWREPLPGEPVMGLDDLRGPAAVRLAAIADTLESLDHESDRELKQALEAELSAQLMQISAAGWKP